MAGETHAAAAQRNLRHATRERTSTSEEVIVIDTEDDVDAEGSSGSEYEDDEDEQEGEGSLQTLSHAHRKRRQSHRHGDGDVAATAADDDGVVRAIEALKLPQFRVGRLKEYHASWDDFSAYLKYYMYATTQTHIAVTQTVSVAEHNEVFAARRTAGSWQPLPEYLGTFSRQYVCTQTLTLTFEHSSVAMHCPFRFIAQVGAIRGVPGAWRIHVPIPTQMCVHNHPVVGGVEVQVKVPAAKERITAAVASETGNEVEEAVRNDRGTPDQVDEAKGEDEENDSEEVEKASARREPVDEEEGEEQENGGFGTRQPVNDDGGEDRDERDEQRHEVDSHRQLPVDKEPRVERDECDARDEAAACIQDATRVEFMASPFLQHDHSRRRSEVKGAETHGEDVEEDGDRDDIADKHYQNDERDEQNERDEPRVDAANDCIEDTGSIMNHSATEPIESYSGNGVAILIDRGPRFEVGFLKDFHASWDDFFSYLNAYMRVTRTKIVISETISVAKRNKTILASAKKRGTHALLLPEEWQTYCRRYICTHGWTRRERGNGLRTRSNLRGRSCEFRFLARMARIQNGEWRIHVPLGTQYRVHTHQIMHEVFEGTPQTVMAPANSASQQLSSNDRCDDRDEQYDSRRAGHQPIVLHGVNSVGSSNVTSAVNDGSQGVQVLGVKEFHASWEAFLEYVDSYMRATHTKVAIHETIRVAQRNKRLLESEKARRGDLVVLIPDEWKTYSRRYICSLGRRKRPRGEGKRARTHCIRSTGCHFTFTAQVACIDNVWCIQVPVPLQVCTHNHPIITETFQSYYSLVPVDHVEQPLHNPEIPPESAKTSSDNAVAPPTSNNFLDIRTIPRDHPMYDAICALVNSSNHTTQAHGETQVVAEFPNSGGHEFSVGRIPAPDQMMALPGITSTLQQQYERRVSGRQYDGNDAEGSYEEDNDRGEYNEDGRRIASTNGEDTQGSDGSGGDDVVYGHRHVSREKKQQTGASYQDGGIHVEVERVKEFHASWESFSAYLKDEYMVSNHTKVVVKETVSVARRNAQILQSKRAQRGGPLCLVPSELQTYTRKYICTHGWDLPSRGKGFRVNKQTRATGCQFRFSAVAVYRAGKHNTWCIQVPEQTQFLVHNHPVEKEIFEKYPQIRTVPKDHPLYDDVRKMVFVGGKKELIFEYIHKHSNFKVTKRDVTNMVCAILAETQQEDADEAATPEPTP
ncbi:hypothetical protein FI667_g10473, partial [Globisporangium splendens]